LKTKPELLREPTSFAHLMHFSFQREKQTDLKSDTRRHTHLLGESHRKPLARTREEERERASEREREREREIEKEREREQLVCKSNFKKRKSESGRGRERRTS